MPKGHISRRCENGEVRTSPFLFRLHQKVNTQTRENDFPCRKRHICKQHLALKLPIIGSAGKIENRRPQPVFSDKTAGRAGVKPGSGRQNSIFPSLPDLASLEAGIELKLGSIHPLAFYLELLAENPFEGIRIVDIIREGMTGDDPRL